MRIMNTSISMSTFLKDLHRKQGINNDTLMKPKISLLFQMKQTNTHFNQFQFKIFFV